MKKFLSLLLTLCLVCSMFMLSACDEPAASTPAPSGSNDSLEVPGTSSVHIPVDPSSSAADPLPPPTETIPSQPTPEKGDQLQTLAGKKPEEVYSASLNKINTIDSFRSEATQVIRMTMDGQTAEMHQSVVTVVDGINCYVKCENDMSEANNMEIWYVDGMYYAITSSLTFKAAIAYEDFTEKYAPQGSTSDDALLNIPSDWFVNSQFICENENEFYLEFVISAEDFFSYFSQSNITAGLDINILENITYRAYFDAEGNLNHIITEFSYEIEGIHVDNYSMTVVTEIGTATVTAPEGTELWTDLTGRI